MFPFELTRPWALAGLLLALPVLGYYFIYSLSDFPARQRRISFVTRVVIVLLLVLSLAGAVYLQTTREQYVVFVVDQSLSVNDKAVEQVDRFLSESLEQLREDQIAFLPFAANAGKMQSQRIVFGEHPSILGKPTDAESKSKTTDEPLDSETAKRLRDGTNIAEAIETATGFLPPGYVPRLVLLSDGNETVGDAIAAASQSRVPISTVALPTRSDPEVQVSEVKVPAEVREGEPFYVEVIIDSNHDDKGLIEIYRGDHKVVSETKELKEGENRFRFEQSIERERLAAFSVRVSGLREDTLLDNNFETGLVYTSGQPRVLIVESDPNLIRELAYALEDEGIQADIRPPQGMPESLSDLQNYELLVLSNVPATDLTQQQMEVARTYVQELGGGFIMLGGEQSFGLGGYYKSSLEEILPVRSDFEKEQEKPSLAMMLVIDKSGSMDGEKIEMAKSAARSAVELLGRKDKVGVLAFDGETYVISEMQSANNKGRISDEIARIDAGGGTTMYPAMEMSYEVLMPTSAKLKHVILLTDGISSPGDFEGLAQQMVSSKITVSTVAVGEGSDVALLEEIARVGKGRHYFTTDAAQVPQIFAKETVTASKSAIDEQPFIPQVIRATHALADIDLDAAPFLLGYVMTKAKPTSEVILATEKGDPLLVWWRYGLGMTVAFTSDAKSRWAAEWLTWPGYGKFWTQVIRQAMRKSEGRGIAVETTRRGKRTSMTVDAVDDLGQFINNAEVELTLIDPHLKRESSLLAQSAPGRYDVEFPTGQSGSYHMEISVKQDGQVVSRQSRGLAIGYSKELRIQKTDHERLKQIARVSGGTYEPSPKEFFKPTAETATRPVPLWPYLVTAALILLILDVALRRIDFSLHWPFVKKQSLERN